MGLFDLFGGGKDTVTTQNVNEPPAFQLPYLQSGFQQAAQLHEQPGPFLPPWAQVVPFSPTSLSAMGMRTDRALAGSPLLKAGQQQLQDTISGTAGNQYLGGLMDMISKRVGGAVNSRFHGSRGADSARDQMMAREISDAALPFLYNASEAERGRQVGAIPLSVSMSEADYGDINQLQGVGAADELKAQQFLDDASQKYGYYQQLPYQKLRDYMSVVGGNMWGGSQTSQQPVFSNPAASGLGGALSGAQLAKMLGYGGTGGAIAGGLLGLFA